MSLSEKENLSQLAGTKSVPSDTWEKAAAYCAYQDRCIMEVRAKLEDFQLSADQISSVLSRLKEEGFLDEQRFVAAFVRGRFSIKKWGRVRIRQELKLRGISEDAIRQGLALIDSDQYEEVLNGLAARKWQATHETNGFVKKAKVQRFLLFRGFETDLVKEAIDRISRQP